MPQSYSFYIHIPFCTHRCAYCDFNTYAGQESSIARYVEALCREIEFIGSAAYDRNDKPAKLHTIFFGGGTPSLLSPDQYAVVLATIQAVFDVVENAELTTEANPGTVSLDALLRVHEAGLNRISFGVQSANSEELRMLERTHTFLDVIEAVAAARKAGFENLNLDLIYGLPEQSLSTWERTLQRVLALHPEHISAYALSLEHGTPFGRWSARGLLPLPDPDLAADMYELAGEMLKAHGYRQYEISNWAKPGRECLHNLQYWRGLPYLAAGAGAHGYADGYRYSNVLRIQTYIERLLDQDFQRSAWDFPMTPATVNFHRQTLDDDMSEFMLTGLRLTEEGIPASVFQERFGLEVSKRYSKEIFDLRQLALLEWSGQNLRLTHHARLLGNRVFTRFV